MVDLNDEEEAQRTAKLLWALTRAMGLRQKDLDERLGMSPGYHGQVFSGRLDLKYTHVLSVLRALGVEPKVFFRALYPDPGDTSLPGSMIERFLDGIQRLGYGTPLPPPPPQPAAGDDEELERRIRDVVEEMLAQHRSKRRR